MGLDMYLTVGLKEKNETLYWRKANAIHRWFCAHGSLEKEGTENVGDYILTKQQLIDLRELCQQVLFEYEEFKKTDMKEEAFDKFVSYCNEHLPTQAGFFFGSTYYDDWYINDLKTTIEQLDEVLPKITKKTEISYYASW